VAGGDDVITAVDAEAAHRWFTALDERSFVVGSKRWLMHVVGIHPDGLDLWIQVDLVGEPCHSGVIRVNPASMVNEAVGAVEALVRDAVGPMACGDTAPRPGLAELDRSAVRLRRPTFHHVGSVRRSRHHWQPVVKR